MHDGEVAILIDEKNKPVIDYLNNIPRRDKNRTIFMQSASIASFNPVAYKDGRIRAVEFYYGSSFLSQSARWLDLTGDIDSVVITDGKGERRRE